MLQVGGGLQQLLYVALADVLGQGAVLLGPGDLGEEFFAVQYLLEIELDGIEAGVQGGLTQLQFARAIQHVAAQAFRREAVNRHIVQHEQELCEFVAVGVLRVRAVSLEP